MLCVGWVGHLISSQWLEPDMLPGAFATFSVVANLFTVYLAVGAITFFVSANSDRRGRSIGVVFGILVFSFLLNFAAQFWDPVKSISFLSVMEYYQPAKIIEANAFPWRNVGVLLCVAIVMWTAGGVVFRRRSICTV